MAKETKIEREKCDPVNGKTDYERLKNMTEEEIEENARNDEDLPLQTDEDFKRFKKTSQKKEK